MPEVQLYMATADGEEAFKVGARHALRGHGFAGYGKVPYCEIKQEFHVG